MKKLFAGLMVLCLLPALAACAAKEAPEEEAAAEPAVTVAAEEGFLIVRVEGNPTTGYEWSWFSEGNSLFQQDGYEYVPGDTSGMLDGAGGLCCFRLAPVAAGETVLYFNYERPWEDEEPVFSFSVSAAVTEGPEGFVIELP